MGEHHHASGGPDSAVGERRGEQTDGPLALDGPGAQRGVDGLVGRWQAWGWLGIPALALTAVLLVAVVAVEVVDGERRDAARVQFDARALVIASLVDSLVATNQRIGAARAADLLTQADLDEDDLRSVVAAMGFTTGAVFDADGRLLVGLSGQPDLVGQDFDEQLEHLRVALTEGRPTVSQAVVSPALDVPAIAIAVPYATPQGRRVLGLVGTLQHDVLRDLLTQPARLERLEITVFDREGRVIASTRGPLGAPVVALADWDPALASALEDRPAGDVTRADGPAGVYSNAAVGQTGWRAAVEIAPARLFAAADASHQAAWGSVGALALLGLVMAPVLAGHRRRRHVAELELRQLNDTLQQRVSERTSELEAANEGLAAALEVATSGERAARRLAAVVEAAGEAIIAEDLDGVIRSWNPAARRLYGYTDEEAIGQPVTMLVPPDGRADAEELLARALDGESVVQREAVRVSRDGFRRWVTISKAPLTDEGGTVVGAVSIHQDLTGQHQAELAEREALAMFAAVFTDGAAPQAVTDLTGRFVRVNDALCELLGHDRDELLTMNVGELIAPTDREDARAHLREIRSGARTSAMAVLHYLHRDGHVVTAATTLNGIDGRDGQPSRIVSMLQDISAQVEAQQQIAEHAAMLGGVTASVGNAITMYDTTGRCVFAAGAGLAAVGFTPDDLVGTTFADRHSHDPDAMEHLRRVLAGEEVDATTEFAGRVYDLRMRPVRGEGLVTHAVAALTDITDRHRAAEATAASERRFRVLVRHVTDAIAQVDGDGLIRDVTPGFEQVLGIGASQVRGRPFIDFFHEDDLPAVSADVHRLLASPGLELHGQARANHADGSVRHVEYHAANLLDDPAVGALVATVRDVTDRVIAENAIREHAAHLSQRNAQLKQASAELAHVNDELQAAVDVRDHVLDATSHELRTPLTPIIGMLELLRQHDDIEPAQLRNYLGVIERNAVRIGSLVEDLLFASQIRAGAMRATPEPITVGRAIRQVLERWPEMGPVNVHDDPDARAWCQPDHFNQIVNSLLSNAVTYGEPPYAVDVSITSAFIGVEVTDDGAGVPEHIRERVFEPFVQGSVGDRRTARGLGLGLHIARTLAQANGGDLVHEAVQGSSRFVLKLQPVNDQPAGRDTDGVATA